ncbi:Ferric-chelate reductase 1 [Trichostrongylus colubriformis]|uniref:Ferric-chelate reductase 1 n=2 Tax=Trichostrongylus colubriformis TaxID=6319 RepID=A0AAN8F5X8_TRICO
MKRRLLFLCLLIQLAASLFDPSKCGTAKECIFSPVGCQEKGECHYMLSYNASEDGWVDMEIFTSIDKPTDNYVAVGFSDDEEMGSDSVTICVFPSKGKPSAHLGYNVGKSNIPATESSDLVAEEDNLKLIHAHKGEDGMYCNVKQKSIVVSVIIEAIGIHVLDPTSPGFPYIHSQPVNVAEVVKREASAQAENAQMNDTPSLPVDEPFLSRRSKFWVIRVHGMLMVFGWLVLVAAAILSARYLRDHFPSSAPCGLKWWFHLHRTLNLTALPLVLIATLLIFIAKDWTWQGPSVNSSSSDNTSPGSIHALLGTIAVLILIMQPLLALMRCQPDTGARPIFNWTHRSLGITAIILAIIAILIATNSFVSLWGDSTWSFSVMIFYIIIVILTVILFELLTYMKNKAPNKSTAMEMRNRSTHRYDDSGRVISNPPKIINSKPLHGVLVLYALFVLFSICVAALLIVMLSV